MKPTLVVMAAGLGSRYGGLKQIEPVGPGGEIIVDYSIYDAISAGFGKVVFVVKKENARLFREKIGAKVETMADAAYVYQDARGLPEGFTAPASRTKPWGTAHAVLCCKDAVRTPFAVINADDFYGRSSFQLLADELKQPRDESLAGRYAMIGFRLANTVTEHGAVARGICTVDGQGFLLDIAERTHIEKQAVGARYTEDGLTFTPLDGDSIVSMNTWGFTTSIFAELEQRFPLFLAANQDNLLKAEYFLPDVVSQLLRKKKATVKVLPTKERWYGVTYKEDRQAVAAAMARMIEEGVYPRNLWGG